MRTSPDRQPHQSHWLQSNSPWMRLRYIVHILDTQRMIALLSPTYHLHVLESLPSESLPRTMHGCVLLSPSFIETGTTTLPRPLRRCILQR